MEDLKYKVMTLDTIVELQAHELNSDYIRTIYNKLRQMYESQCNPRLGYVKRNSLRITKKSEGGERPNSLMGSFIYNIRFECKSYRPIAGDRIQCIVSIKNEAGIMAKALNFPFNIYIMKELEKNPDTLLLIEKIEEKSVIEISVIKAELNAEIHNYEILGEITNLINDFTKDFELIVAPSEHFLIAGIMVDKSQPDINASLKYLNKLRTVKSKIGEIKHNDLVKSFVFNKQLELLELGDESADNSRVYWGLINSIIFDYSLLEKPDYFPFVKNLISRAFYKMIEMANEFPLFNNSNMCIVNLAESPGGFVQALLYARNLGTLEPFEDNYYVFSIPEMGKTMLWEREKSIITKTRENKNIFGPVHFDNKTKPSSVISNTPQVHLIDELYGNVINSKTHKYMLEQCGLGNKAHLVTADGAYGELGYANTEEDYNNQEIQHYKLFTAEIKCALILNALNGHFVLKVFDIVTPYMCQLLYILSQCYKTVHIYKPVTSKQSNSEKYIICMNYYPGEYIDTLISYLDKIIEDIGDDGLYNCNIDIEVPEDFIEKIKLYNDMFIKTEIRTIEYGLEISGELISLIEKSSIEDFNKYIASKNKTKKGFNNLFIKKYMPSIEGMATI